MKYYKPNQKSKGSVLIEAMVSLAIVSVGSLSLINLQGNLIRARADANQKNEATVLAKAKIEELRNYLTAADYTAIASGSDSTSGVTTNYTRSWTVSDFSNPNYKMLSVNVSWPNQDGTTHSINMNSRVAQLSVVNSGKAMDSSSGQPTLTPPNSNYIGNQGNVNEQPQNNGGGQDSGGDVGSQGGSQQDSNTTFVTMEDGTVLEYDNDSGQVVTINGHNAVSITGNITEATGRDSPASINYADVVVSANGSGNSYCSYSVTETKTVGYTCFLQNTFTGTIDISGVRNVKVCSALASNRYENQLVSLSGQDYVFFKKTRNCSGSTPNEIDRL